MILFTINAEFLNKFGQYFGAARGADVLVYISVIILMYLYFELLNTSVKDDYHLTNLVSHISTQKAYEEYVDKIHGYTNQSEYDEYIFFVRAYNEYKTIWSVIDQIFDAGFGKIMIVDDSGRHQFHQLITEKQHQYPNKLIIHIQHAINRWRGGGGASLKTGLTFLRQYGDELNIKRVVGFDADDQMDIADMKTFMKYLHQVEQGKAPPVEILLGSRFVTGGKAHNIPLSRRIVLFGAKFITYLFNRIWISDSHCGYRIYSLHASQVITIISDGMVYANELNDEIRQKKLSFVELPVNIRYTDYSLWRGQRSSNAIKILIELLYRKLFYR